ncbi:MAG: hypothetical protein NTZ34_00365 [Chloroflexi bacterium]|nr:hypothetical protein [Chloroflexota bacterium]
MEAKKIFAEILKKDGKMRLLLGGILLDGSLIIALVILAGVVAL